MSWRGVLLLLSSLSILFVRLHALFLHLLLLDVLALCIFCDRSISFFLLVFVLLAAGAIRGLLLNVELACLL